MPVKTNPEPSSQRLVKTNSKPVLNPSEPIKTSLELSLLI